VSRPSRSYRHASAEKTCFRLSTSFVWRAMVVLCGKTRLRRWTSPDCGLRFRWFLSPVITSFTASRRATTRSFGRMVRRSGLQEEMGSTGPNVHPVHFRESYAPLSNALRRLYSCRTTVRRDLFTLISPLYSMKPSFLNLFMNRFTRVRVVPIISASVSCETF
jgi:hypothetical protein